MGSFWVYPGDKKFQLWQLRNLPASLKYFVEFLHKRMHWWTIENIAFARKQSVSGFMENAKSNTIVEILTV